MFHTPPSTLATPIPRAARRALWVVEVFDVMVVAWMLPPVGDWLDRYSPLTAVVTLGGHHGVVLGVAVAAFVALALLAAATGGFGVATRMQLGLLSAAVAVSIVAGAGVLSVALLVGAAALVVAVIGWGLLRR